MRVGSATEEARRAAMVSLASHVLGLQPAEVEMHPGRWGAFLAYELLDDCLLPAVDWERLSVDDDALDPDDDDVFGVRRDIDLAGSILRDQAPRQDLEPSVRQERYHGLLGTEVQRAYQQGRRVVEAYDLPGIEAKLKGCGHTLLDAVESLLGWVQPEAVLWAPRSGSGYRVAERHLDFVRGIAPAPLRIHIGGFFQASRRSPAGALFVDDVVRQHDRAFLRHLGMELPAPPTAEPVTSASWRQCPCEGHGPHGVLTLCQLDADGRPVD